MPSSATTAWLEKSLEDEQVANVLKAAGGPWSAAEDSGRAPLYSRDRPLRPNPAMNPRQLPPCRPVARPGVFGWLLSSAIAAGLLGCGQLPIGLGARNFPAALEAGRPASPPLVSSSRPVPPPLGSSPPIAGVDSLPRSQQPLPSPLRASPPMAARAEPSPFTPTAAAPLLPAALPYRPSSRPA